MNSRVYIQERDERNLVNPVTVLAVFRTDIYGIRKISD